MAQSYENGHMSSNIQRLVQGRIKNFVSEGTNKGAVLIKELIQNADDAKGSRLHVVLDERSWQREGGGYESLFSPGLIVVNDAPFEADNFEAITTIAKGLKEHDAVSAGRFGVGFLSVFLVAETVMLFSARRAILFDFNNHIIPQPTSGREENLRFWNWERSGTIPESEEEELFNYLIPDSITFKGGRPRKPVSGNGSFERSAFRLCLRRDNQGKKLGDEIFQKEEDRYDLLQEMMEEAGKALVFAQSLTVVKFSILRDNNIVDDQGSIEVSRWPSGYREFLDQIETSRGQQAPRFEWPEQSIPGYRRKVTCTILGERTEQEFLYRFACDYGNPQVSGISEGFRDNEKSIPWCGIAVPFSLSDENKAPAPWHVTLPTIEHGPSQVCFHGGFFLDSDRRGPIYSRDKHDSKYYTQWNEALISEVIISLFRSELSALNTNIRSEEDVIKVLRYIPKYRQKSSSDSKGPQNLAEYFSSTYYSCDWSVALLDARGSKFDLSGRDIHRPGRASAIRIQELNHLLAGFTTILPSEEQDQRIYYVSSRIYAALADRFPNAPGSWLKKATDVSQKTVLDILDSDKFSSLANESTLTELVRLLDPEHPEFRDRLPSLHLFWSISLNCPVRYSPDALHIRDSVEPSPAYLELQQLQLHYDAVHKVDAQTGAGNQKEANRLGLTTILDPSDEAVLRLLERVAHKVCRHDRFDVEEVLRLSSLHNLLKEQALQAPERLTRLRLAWMICTDGGNNGGVLDTLVVFHSSGWNVDSDQREAVETLWEKLIVHLFPFVEGRVAKLLAPLQDAFEAKRPTIWDENEGREVVRTKPNELLKWLSFLYWQKGDITKQKAFIDKLSPLIENLNRDEEHGTGSDAIIKACSKFSFLAHEHMLLYSLPLHLTESGERIPLLKPEDAELDGKKKMIRKEFRLKPRGDIPRPSGFEYEFTLLDPQDKLRFFYQDTLGIAEDTKQLAVEDLLHSMNGYDVPTGEVHRERLEYLSVRWPELLADKHLEPEKLETLRELLEHAHLIYHQGSVYRIDQVADCPGILEELQQLGWANEESKALLMGITAPRFPLVIDDEYRRMLRNLELEPRKIGLVDLAKNALESDSPSYGIEDRIRLLAGFANRLSDADRPLPSSTLQSFQIPVWGTQPVELSRSIILERWRFELPDEVYQHFFPNAIHLKALSERCHLDEEKLRNAILPILGVQEITFSTACSQVAGRFPEQWKMLSTEGQLVLLDPAKEKKNESSRWQLSPETLVRHAFKAFDRLEITSDRLRVYERLIELVCNTDNAQKISDGFVVNLADLIFPCKDGHFHLANNCWPSDWYGGSVELLEGSSMVVKGSVATNRLLRWLAGVGSKVEKIEEMGTAEKAGEINSLGEGRKNTSVYPWYTLISEVLRNPDSKLSIKVAELSGRLFTNWEVHLVDRLPVSILLPSGRIRASSTWEGPACAFLPESKSLCIRKSSIPSPSDSSGLKRLDRQIAAQLCLALGDDPTSDSSQKSLILSALERPHDFLSRLGKERRARLIERYDEMNADIEFSETLSEWRMLDDKTPRYKELEEDLRNKAASGLLKARRDEMEQLGYSQASFYTELVQNAEDACIQRHVLGMGSPPSRKIVFSKEGGVITIRHFGRPFNYWRHGEKKNSKYRKDIERITSDRGSHKQTTEGEETTGRFGLGFKCVYWVTDYPEIHSDVWSFRIESTCVPVPIGPPEEHPLDATTIRLPLRTENDSFGLLSPQQAAKLLLFTREIDCIETRDGNGSAVEVQKHIARLNESTCIGTINGVEQVIDKFLILENGISQIAIRLHTEDATPVRVSAPEDDFYARYPMTGVHHNHGVIVSSDFAVQSGRSHLKPASINQNKDAFDRLGEILSLAGEGLQLASAASSISATEWFNRFWNVWNMQTPPDSAVEGLSSRLGKGLLKLATKSPVIPRLSGKLLSLSSMPCSAYSQEIPVRFRLHLTAAIEEHGWDQGLAVSFDHLIDDKLARKVDALANRAEIESPVEYFGWDMLNSCFQGRGSLFISKPELLERLHESLILSDKSTDTERSKEVRSFLKECYFECSDGNAKLAKQMWNTSWLEESGLPDFGYKLFPRPSERYSPSGLNLLDLTESISWEEFQNLLSLASDQHAALASLRFLERTRSWRSSSWTNSRDYLVNHVWFPLNGIRFAISDPRITDLLKGRFSLEFLEWLLGPTLDYIPVPPLSDSPALPDGSEILNRIKEWWDKCKDDEITKYESTLYPEDFVFPSFLSIQEQSPRESWMSFFILGVAHTLGRTQEVQHRTFLERVRRLGWLDVFSDPDSTGDQWIEILDSYFEESATGIGYYHWLRLFAPIRCLSKYLDVYYGSFDDIDRHGNEKGVEQFLNPGASPRYQGSTREAPPGTQVMGMGACFMLRELRRKGVIRNSQIDNYCFVPKGLVRNCLRKIANIDIDRRFEGSRQIAHWIRRHNGGMLETFDECFDLPFQVLGRDHNLLSEVTKIPRHHFMDYSS